MAEEEQKRQAVQVEDRLEMVASSQGETFSSAGVALEKEAGKESKVKAVSSGKGRGKDRCDRRNLESPFICCRSNPEIDYAFANLKKICDKHLAGKYRIEVIDLLKNPQLAKGDQIIPYRHW